MLTGSLRTSIRPLPIQTVRLGTRAFTFPIFPGCPKWIFARKAFLRTWLYNLDLVRFTRMTIIIAGIPILGISLEVGSGGRAPECRLGQTIGSPPGAAFN